MVPSSLGLPTAWHCSQPAVDGRMAFRHRERIGRALGAAGLELLAEGDLLRRQACGAVNRGPARRGVTAAQKFLVDVFVARAAIAGGEMVADDEAVMVLFVLAGGGLVAIEAVDVLAAWADISYSWTTEYCSRAWHSAHLPEARTKSAVGCSVSTFGRARFTRKAARIRAKETVTARKIERNCISGPPGEIARASFQWFTHAMGRVAKTLAGAVEDRVNLDKVMRMQRHLRGRAARDLQPSSIGGESQTGRSATEY